MARQKTSHASHTPQKALYALRPLWRMFGARLFAVGGCVRDVLSQHAIGDIDAAVRMPIDEAEALLTRASIPFIRTGAGHGGITVCINGFSAEITATREDVSCDGRHADIRFTADMKKDAHRRDFTINGLYWQPGAGVTDYVGGVDDIKRGRLRFIGHPETRCEEDVLRVWRYFRFLSELPYMQEADAATQAACVAFGDNAAALPRERIAGELIRLYTGDQRFQAFSAMQASECLRDAACLASFAYDDRLAAYGDTLRDALSVPDDALYRVLSVHAPSGRIEAQRLSAALLLPKAQRVVVERIAVFFPENGDVDAHCFAASLDSDHPEEARLLAALAGLRVYRLHGMDAARDAVSAYGDYIDMLERQYGIFPVFAADIMPYIVHKKQIGMILRMLRDRWRSSRFTATREQLLHIAKESGNV